MDPESTAGPVALDVIEGAEHATGAAFDAVFKRHDEFLLAVFPLIHLSGANGGAGLIVALV